MNRTTAAVPRAGATLATLLGPWAHRVLDSYQALLAGTTAPSFRKSEAIGVYLKRYSPVHPSWAMSEEQLVELAASATLSTVLVALASGRSVKTLEDAERWFFGGEPAIASSGWASDEVIEPLLSLGEKGINADVLPHIFEVFVTGPIAGSRSSDPQRRNNRGAKRRNGVFYTPEDVARYVCDSVLDMWQTEGPRIPNVLDPACGTGSFLLAALKVLNARYGPSPTHVNHLYGVDISPAAVQATRFSLVAAHCGNPNLSRAPIPVDLYHSTGQNFLTSDATQLFLGADEDCVDGTRDDPQLSFNCLSPDDLRGRAPDLGRFSSAFDVVVGNPPYSSAQAGRASAYLPFIRMMWEATTADGAAGMVVPLSISYNTTQPHTRIREQMRAVPGDWKMAFFDRTPDSLFGDDVKTRNAIVLLGKNATGRCTLSTTSFVRWNSRKRSQLFSGLQFVASDWGFSDPLIPKLGSVEERRAYKHLRTSDTPNLGSDIVPIVANNVDLLTEPEMLHFSSTAYNWIPAFRRMPHNGPFRRGYWTIQCRTATDADVVFAITSSRFSYWLWRVEGDGFHLSRKFIMSLPITLAGLSNDSYQALRRLATELWAEMVQRPIRTRNAGQISLTLSPEGSEAILDQIDSVLCRSFGLRADFLDFLRRFSAATIAAGRER